ncbi:uncharacterized protein LOC108106923 [Drosophila eugracilis]|uniref:uncharacterized protein LOC108106923 n=1 Tax=Drosophila eugracilis TaxID=29029 RepID=UPI001BDA228D|nr:uncharacterized protein LOC108106923 [Drosophila eugracilis]
MENFEEQPSTSKGNRKSRKDKKDKKKTAETYSAYKVSRSLSCGSNRNVLPTKFCFNDFVLDFGTDEDSEPIQVLHDIDSGSGSSKTAKMRSSGAKSKVKQLPKARKMGSKSSVEVERPILQPDPLNPRPISPTKLPSSMDIWKNYKAMVEGSVLPSEAEWPLCCIFGEVSSTSTASNPPPKTGNSPQPPKSPLKEVERDVNSDIDAMLYWEKYGRGQNIRQEEGNSNDFENYRYTRTIGVEEEQAMNDWIEAEGLREPMSDMAEYDMLLSLAMDYDKNKDLLFQILKPASLVNTPVKESKKFIPPKKIFSDFKYNQEEIIEKVQPVSVTAKPGQGEQLIDPGLGTSSAFTIKERVNVPLPSTQPDPISFGSVMKKEEMIPKSPGKATITLSTVGGWNSSFTLRLEDSEKTVDPNMKENVYKQGESPISINDQVYDLKAVEKLKRTLELPPVLSKVDKVHPEYSKLDLKTAANTLKYAVYNSTIDVIKIEYSANIVAWLWSDGTVLIINGLDEAMLSGVQKNLVAMLIGNSNFKADASHNLMYSRLISCASYPYKISLPEFGMIHVLSRGSNFAMMPFVYFVDKDLPGVAARINQRGVIDVFAMITTQADEMLKKLYVMTANVDRFQVSK